MHKLLFPASLTLVFSAISWSGDGVPPRTSSSDYPVHQEAKAVTVAATRITAEQLNKTFPSDLAKKYIVLEVAIYPKEGPAVQVEALDFVLKFGADAERHPDTAEDVAWIWHPAGIAHPDATGNTPHVTTESGVILASGQDPATGRRVNNVGTYEGVAVSNGPNQTAQAPAARVDADRLEALLKKFALPEGKINSPIAGYLYFRIPAKKTKGALELQYAHDGSSADLTLPAK